jgi:hypothetical protein
MRLHNEQHSDTMVLLGVSLSQRRAEQYPMTEVVR